MKRIFTVMLIWGICLSTPGQDDAAYLEIIRAETQLKSMFDQLYRQDAAGLQMELYHAIDSAFTAALELPGSFDHTWSKLNQIGKLASEDGHVKVFSWLYQVSMNDYRYSAFIQLSEKGDSEIFKLRPASGEHVHDINFEQEIDRWDGKIYYDLVTKKHRRKVFYTLVGADFNDAKTSLKTIEVMVVQRGTPLFLQDQFLIEDNLQDRIVLEYSADLAATVRYNETMDMIVYDHLAPLHPIYSGNYQFYGPDGSYDGLKFTKGIWVLEQDIDARNE